jgi:serine protease Do
LAERFRLKEEKGVLITKIDPDSPGEQELREGDLIKEIDHQSINSVEDFNKIAAKLKDSDNILIRVVRESRAFYVVLKPKG